MDGWLVGNLVANKAVQLAVQTDVKMAAQRVVESVVVTVGMLAGDLVGLKVGRKGKGSVDKSVASMDLQRVVETVAEKAAMVVFSDEMMAGNWDGLMAGMMVVSVVERSVE
jgi:hypothetical protein